MEVKAEGEVPCRRLAALGEAIDQRLGSEAAPAERGLRLSIRGQAAGLLHVRLSGANGHVLFRRPVESGSLSCDDLVASLSLLASIWIRQTSSLEAAPRREKPEPPPSPRTPPAPAPVDAGASEPMAIASPVVADAGSDVDTGAELETDAGVIVPPPPVDAGITNAVVPLAVESHPVDEASWLRWAPALGGAVQVATGIGVDGTLVPYWLGFRVDGALHAELGAELEANLASPLHPSPNLGGLSIAQEGFAGRLALSPWKAHPQLRLLAGPSLEVVTVTSSVSAGSHTLWDAGAQVGARWSFVLVSQVALEVGLIAEVRGHREDLQVSEPGGSTIAAGSVPAFWLMPELALHAALF